MITEETIKQTNFYKSLEDGQPYLVTDVRIVKLVTLINCVDITESKLLLGDDICRTFVPVVPAFEPVIENQVAAAKPAAAKAIRGPYNKRAVKAEAKKQSPKAGTKTGKRKKSQYKGVSPMKPLRSGKIRYQAVYWDGEEKKSRTIGAYDREIEAAAVYQDHIGNKDEANRLRALDKQDRADMGEQKENNPDRPGSKLKTWECTSCKFTFKHPTKPTSCINCKGASFKHIP